MDPSRIRRGSAARRRRSIQDACPVTDRRAILLSARPRPPPASGGGGWTPASLSPLAWWYAHADYITESGGAVSQWSDRSGNGNHLTQSNASLKPTFSSTGWNGSKGAVTFDGSLDRLAASSGTIVSAFDGEDKPQTVFMALEWLDLDADQGIAEWHDSGGVTRFTIRTNATGTEQGNLRYQRRDGSGTTTNTGSTSFGLQRATLGWIFTGTAITTYVNGTLDLSGAANNQGSITVNALSVGVTPDDGLIFNGRIAEMVVTDTVLTAGDYSSYRTYAAAEWGGLP